MPHPLRRPCLAGALALAVALAPGAHAGTRVGPPAGDILGAFMKQRLQFPSERDTLPGDAGFVRRVLRSPDSVYSGLSANPLRFNAAGWSRAFGALNNIGYNFTAAEATEAMAWDLGLTNGYPALEDPDYPVANLGARWAGTQLAKASVQEHIARKALALAGDASFAVAANYAVAAQILSEKLNCFEENQWDTLGLRVDVLQRFLVAQSVADLREYDLMYLVRLLQAELSTWSGGGTGSWGRRMLPTALRVARVAAAFRDMQGYADSPCTTDGVADLDVAGSDALVLARPMCLVDASDRAVLAWYQRVLFGQMDHLHTNFLTQPAARLTRVLRPMRPLWLGVFDRDMVIHSASVEVMAALVADREAATDAETAEADRYAQRRNIFLCEKEQG